MSTGEILSEIKQLLEPGQVTKIEYTFRVPALKDDENIVVLKLSLVGGQGHEKFGDAMTGVCSIK